MAAPEEIAVEDKEMGEMQFQKAVNDNIFGGVDSDTEDHEPECCSLWMCPSGQQSKIRENDMVLDISNIESVLDRKKGWHMKLRSYQAWEEVRKSKTVKVGIVGVYNRGKSTLTNLLSNRATKVGNLEHTQGLSVVLYKNFALLDTAGQNQPLDLSSQDGNKVREITTGKLISDLFGQDLVVYLSDLLIVVVNQLTLEDQRYVRVLEEKLNAMEKAGVKKSMVVVHNLKDVENEEDLEVLIKKDIEKGFECTETLWQEDMYWLSKSNIAHCVICRNGSVAGNMINSQTVSYLRNKMNACFGESKKSRQANLLQGINDFVYNNLHKFFNDLEQKQCVLHTVKKPKEGRDDLNLKLFVNCRDAYKMKENAIISEWQIIWGAKYELDYEVLRSDDEMGWCHVVVRIDVPGIFQTNPATAKPTLKDHNKYVHTYEWAEDRGEGYDTILSLTIRLARLEGKGPSVELHARRDNWGRNSTCVAGSGKNGKVDLKVDLSHIYEAYENATVDMGGTGVLSIDLKYPKPRK